MGGFLQISVEEIKSPSSSKGPDAKESQTDLAFKSSWSFLRFLQEFLHGPDQWIRVGKRIVLEEFRKVASWVSGGELSDHIAEVVFVLLDDQGQGRIFKENLGPLLFDWRQPRGFDKSSLHIQLGNLKI